MLGQRKLLKWSGAGLSHFFTFLGFNVLGLTVVEAFGALVLSQDFAFPLFGRARWLGFVEDFFAVAVLVAIIWFAINRLRQRARPSASSATAASTARTTAPRGPCSG